MHKDLCILKETVPNLGCHPGGAGRGDRQAEAGGGEVGGEAAVRDRGAREAGWPACVPTKPRANGEQTQVDVKTARLLLELRPTQHCPPLALSVRDCGQNLCVVRHLAGGRDHRLPGGQPVRAAHRHQQAHHRESACRDPVQRYGDTHTNFNFFWYLKREVPLYFPFYKNNSLVLNFLSALVFFELMKGLAQLLSALII